MSVRISIRSLVTLAGALVVASHAGVAPQVTQSPTNQIVGVGQTAQFTVTATGSPDLSYRWFKGFLALPDNDPYFSGTSTPTLTLTNISPGYAGHYWAGVTNSDGWATSQVATLTVTGFPAIVSQPQNIAVLLGSKATLAVGVSGANFTCAWVKEESATPAPLDATNTTLTIDSVTTNDAGLYYLRSPDFGFSRKARLSVYLPPAWNTTQQNLTLQWYSKAARNYWVERWNGNDLAHPGNPAWLNQQLVTAGGSMSSWTSSSPTSPTNAFFRVMVADPPPAITGIVPDQTRIASGATAIITGQNFQFGMEVLVGGFRGAGVQLLSSSILTFAPPIQPFGTYDVIITNPDGQSATKTNAFSYTDY